MCSDGLSLLEIATGAFAEATLLCACRMVLLQGKGGEVTKKQAVPLFKA